MPISPSPPIPAELEGMMELTSGLALLSDIAEDFFPITYSDKDKAQEDLHLLKLAQYLLDDRIAGGDLEAYFKGIPGIETSSMMANEVLNKWCEMNPRRSSKIKGGFLLSVLAVLFRNNKRKVELLTDNIGPKLLNRRGRSLNEGKRGYTCACSDRPSHGQ